MHASAWFADRSDEEVLFLPLMVFFEGAPGWHDKPTDFKWEIKSSPATINMTVGSTPIHVKYWATTKTVQIMEHRFELATDNVFLVSSIDEQTPGVRGLGRHDLTFVSGDNPALVLLRRDADILAALLDESDESVPSKDISKTASDLAAMDLQGMELLAKNTPEDDKQGCDFFRKAAEKGYAPSQYRLGLCYGTGRGVQEDLAVANQWYLKAAEQDFVHAQYKLAHSYRVGRGVTIDPALAVQWYTRAAANADAEAQYNLGVMYRDGEGVPKDLTSSYTWLLVLRTQRKSIDPESWRRVEDLLASVQTNIGSEAKEVAEARAQALLRSYTRHYLKGLRQ